MEVVDPAELIAAAEECAHVTAFGYSRRDDEADEREPDHRADREPGQRYCRREEDGRAERQRERDRASGGPMAGDDNCGEDVGGGEERCRRQVDHHLGEVVTADHELVGERDRQRERQRHEEVTSVEAQRLGDELPDGAGLGRQRGRQRPLRRRLLSIPTARHDDGTLVSFAGARPR